MPIGKLPRDTLNRLLATAKTDPRVIVGPAYGEDAAAVEFSAPVLVAASDPVTFTTDHIGYYAVSVNANDIAVTGAVPRYFLATILLPEGSSESDAEDVFGQITRSCDAIGVILIGGHTEITQAVDRVVVSGTMLGESDRDSLISSSGARVGDGIVLAGPIAIEGTGILAREAADNLIARGIDEQTISRAASYIDDYGICILEHAKAAIRTGCVTSMHDPTEGGLATALHELASASRAGALISRDAIPILHECRVICEALGLDPLGLIASGCLLLTVPSDAVEATLGEFKRSGTPATIIGHVHESQLGIRFEDGTDVPLFDRDEIARYFAGSNTPME